MTLEELRAAKEAAQAGIRDRLLALQKETGMCPIDVSISLIDVTTCDSRSQAVAIGNVIITFEPV